jgi:hypothetical protein
MMLRGLFTKPLGSVYDCFDENYHVIDDFEIPSNWPVYVGVDFGGANTAAVCIAEDPNESEWESPDGMKMKGHRLYLFGSYKEGSRSSAGHAEGIKERAHAFRGHISGCFGGAKGEKQSRTDFTVAGLAIAEPLATGHDSVAVGIQRVYRLLKRGELLIFDMRGRRAIEELKTYTYKTDPETYEATGEIKDKNKFHRMDALRYVCSSIRPGDAASDIKKTTRYGGRLRRKSR